MRRLLLILAVISTLVSTALGTGGVPSKADLIRTWRPEDIKQRTQDNCWWLATLIAVVDKNAARFSSLMDDKNPNMITLPTPPHGTGLQSHYPPGCPIWLTQNWKEQSKTTVSRNIHTKWWPDAITHAAETFYNAPICSHDNPTKAFTVLYGTLPDHMDGNANIKLDTARAEKMLRQADRKPTVVGFVLDKNKPAPEPVGNVEHEAPAAANGKYTLRGDHAYAVESTIGNIVTLIDPNTRGDRYVFRGADILDHLEHISQMDPKGSLIRRAVKVKGRKGKSKTPPANCPIPNTKGTTKSAHNSKGQTLATAKHNGKNKSQTPKQKHADDAAEARPSRTKPTHAHSEVTNHPQPKVMADASEGTTTAKPKSKGKTKTKGKQKTKTKPKTKSKTKVKGMPKAKATTKTKTAAKHKSTAPPKKAPTSKACKGKGCKANVKTNAMAKGKAQSPIAKSQS